MNDLSIAKPFHFNIEPIFQIYNEISDFIYLPTPEAILSLYDLSVNAKLRDLQFELGDIKDAPWKTHKLSEEDRRYIEGIIGMKVILETKEVEDVFKYFYVMYVDNYGEYHNIPVKDVW